MPDQQIQVNLEDDFVNDTINKYLNKKEELEKFKEQLVDLMTKIDKLIDTDTKDIVLCNEIKNVREETYAYSQKNLELQRKNRCLREYLELKRQKDDIELDIYENDMRRQLRINMIETKYLITPSNNQIQNSNSNTQQSQQINIPQSANVENKTLPINGNVPPPPPPPPINNSAPPPPPPPKNSESSVNSDKNTPKPERRSSMDLSGELKNILNQKFKGARGEDD